MSVSGSGTATIGVEDIKRKLSGLLLGGGLNSSGSGHAKPDAIAG
jgi:hypothetical protein